MSRNLILWVIDQQHRTEQQVSEASVKRHMPDVDTRCFVVERQTTWYDVYIKTLQESLSLDYDNFLFLDSDTYLVEPVYDIFAVLDTGYDIVSTHAPARETAPILLAVDAYPELNTGVFGYRSSFEVESLFQDWLDTYYLHHNLFGDNDQAPLRMVMYQHGTKVWILPPEYNCRWHLGGFASGKVKILHARSANIEKVAEEINRNTGMRVWEQGTFR